MFEKKPAKTKKFKVGKKTYFFKEDAQFDTIATMRVSIAIEIAEKKFLSEFENGDERIKTKFQDNINELSLIVLVIATKIFKDAQALKPLISVEDIKEKYLNEDYPTQAEEFNEIIQAINPFLDIETKKNQNTPLPNTLEYQAASETIKKKA